MASGKRIFNLSVWNLALGYFFFYAPYCALVKVTAQGLWPGMSDPVSGFRMLPAVVVSTAFVMLASISLMGWWKYANQRQFFGLSVPCPSRRVLLPGLGTAVIIGATTLCFTFSGVSIVFVLVLMRGGVFIIAPVIDRVFRRRVRWFSWAALTLSVAALLVALADVNNYRMSVVATLTIAAYLMGYLLRLPFINKLAKSDDEVSTRRYFVEEMLVALVLLVAIPAVFACLGEGNIASELRQGFTGFFSDRVTIPAIIIGALYAGLFCFGTLIYLDCRENSFCIPLNRGSSLLAGVFASYALASFFGQSAPSGGQLGSAGLIVVALLLLSPLHHFRRTLEQLRHSLAAFYQRLLNLAASFGRQPSDQPSARTLTEEFMRATHQAGSIQEQFKKPRRMFLFVCSGNTCRSPMAAAMGNAEIAARLKIPSETPDTADVQALSAGVSARVGAPMMPEAQQALRLLNVPVRPHTARNLTIELAHQVELIFCMTDAHRKAVIDMIPSVAGKTHCLDPDGDIEDPIGHGQEAYFRSARHIYRLVRWRFDEALLNPSL